MCIVPRVYYKYSDQYNRCYLIEFWMSTEPVNPIVRIYIELQGTYIRGSLIVYIVVPRVIYAKSRHVPPRSYEVCTELDLNI